MITTQGIIYTLKAIAGMMFLILLGAIIFQSLEPGVNFTDSVRLMTANATTTGSATIDATTLVSKWFLTLYSIVLAVYFVASFFILFELYKVV